MSGLTGWIDFKRNVTGERTTLKGMADTIAHRGVDAEGFWTSKHAALANRRLIVIDPDGGKQPMVFQEGEEKLVITYDGEIYNYRELTKELLAKGHRFETNSDTEVLLHCYLEWRGNCVQHLNGMFAFAIWDEKRETLFMARDRMGVKPLFYAEKNGALIFGSEIKAILAHPDVDAQLDQQGMAEILALGPMHTPGNGVFKDIHELRAGHALTATRDNMQIRQYWKLVSQPFTDSVPEASEQVRNLLIDAVKHQLVSDKPVTSLLSGGLDSSALVSIAAPEFKKDGNPFLTYSIDFKNNEQHFQKDFVHESRDTPYVYEVARAVGTKHHNHVVDAKDLTNNLLEPMFARDLPGVGEMETSLYLLFQEMAQHTTVALTGESADEVFGGYPWFYQEEFLKSDTFPWAIRSEGRSQILNQEMIDYIQPQKYTQQRYKETLEEVPHLSQENELDRRRREMQYMNLTRFLPFLMDRTDRMSMRAGFEVRAPICDHRIVEYLWNMPWDIKAVDNMEKGILRRSVNGILIDDVRTRKKSAYPFNQDPNYLQTVTDWLKSILNDTDAPIKNLINTNQVEKALDNTNGQMAARLCDYLIQVNEWLKHYEVKIL